MDKKSLSERDICTKCITPAILAAGWSQHQFREEVKLTYGRVMVRGQNILVDQTMQQDFASFGDSMHKIANRQVKKNYEIYLALYQAMTGKEEWKHIYRQFPADFFDLVVVDECHRGSAAEDSAWRDVLDYFASATHLGLTVTPEETKDVSNSTYFGEAIYTYSLKQGIEDGFLAPYKVIRIVTDADAFGYTPEKGKTDKLGQAVEQRQYNTKDFDRNLVLEKRTTLVARRVGEYLQATDPMAKTIVFCDDQDHAERMRQELVKLIPAAASNRRYVMRITGDDDEGKAQLSYFIDNDEPLPVIATTSKLLATGVDAKTCKLIVLDQNIESMTEFKQIIGRGTRIREDYRKPDAAWLKKSDELTKALIELHEKGDVAGRNKLIDDNADHWGEIKAWLLGLSHKKCWFSEARDIYSHMDVEHFRPKLEAKDLDGRPREGYWWLAFDYTNYRACGNVGNRKKGGWFPLQEGSLISSYRLRCEESEAHYLLDPTDRLDVNLLAFDEQGNAIPTPGSTPWERQRVDETVKRLKLNEHELLREERQKVWHRVSTEIDQYMTAMDRNAHGHNPAAKKDADSHARAIYEMTREDMELSSVAKWCVQFRNDPKLNRLIA